MISMDTDIGHPSYYVSFIIVYRAARMSEGLERIRGLLELSMPWPA